MLNYIQRFNPFYLRRDSWEHRKYITFNWFKGYSLFDAHFWKPDDRTFCDGGDINTKRIMMFGATLFYFRFEVFFNWGHKGRSWRY